MPKVPYSRHHPQVPVVKPVKANYRIAKEGYFLRQYYKVGTVISLYPKQAKYALLSGQLEAVEPVPAQTRHAAHAPKPRPAGQTERTGPKPSEPRSVGGSMVFRRS
jgi:hypothetical protein